MKDINKQIENIIDNMPPGPKMDRLVAAILDSPTLPYSTNMANAYNVIEWCLDEGGDLFIEYWQDGEWFICNRDLHSRKTLLTVVARSDKVDDCELPSMPIAICRYALKCGVQMGLINSDWKNMENRP